MVRLPEVSQAQKTTRVCFELANGGTLYLDEVNSLNVELQAKLLRVLQDGVLRRVGDTKTKEVDVRIIASTNEPAAELLEKKLLREDFYYRLNVIYFELPPLRERRERREDIDLLVQYFIKKYNKDRDKKVTSVSKEAMRVLEEYFWPGNIRELEHLIESTISLIDKAVISLDDIQYYFNKRSKQAVNNNYPSYNNVLIQDINLALDDYEKKFAN